MADNPTYDKFKGIIADQLGVEIEQVTPDASLVDDLNADSLDLVELVQALDEDHGALLTWALSHAEASANIVVSRSAGAMIWRPTGKPARVGAHGTLIAGSPARLAGSV